MNLIDGKYKKAFIEASDPIITSVVMFLIFSTFFRFIFDQPQFLGKSWPVLLIVWGLWMMVKPYFRKRRKISVVIGDDNDALDAMFDEDEEEEVEEVIS